MRLFHEVFENYLGTKERLDGLAKSVRAPDQLALKVHLPNFFRKALEVMHQGEWEKVKDQYIFQGSFGRGNICDVPWVATYHSSVTRSAESGFYIVLLFSADMESCFLSLNQGFTQIKKEFSPKLAKEKVALRAERAAKLIGQSQTAIFGPINLKAKKDLGKGYEIGAIKSYYYPRGIETPASQVEADFNTLIEDYEKLRMKCGSSLDHLAPVHESDFQKAVLDCTTRINTHTFEVLSPQRPADPVFDNGRQRYPRNPNMAAQALKRAGYVCDLDRNHLTFPSTKKDQPYLEAHHLIPLSEQWRFTFSLDVVSNIVSLCPTCHRLLHCGLPKSKRPHLESLFSRRYIDLVKQGIKVTPKDLFLMYQTEFEDELG